MEYEYQLTTDFVIIVIQDYRVQSDDPQLSRKQEGDRKAPEGGAAKTEGTKPPEVSDPIAGEQT